MEINKESNIHEAVLKISIAVIKEEFKKENGMENIRQNGNNNKRIQGL